MARNRRVNITITQKRWPTVDLEISSELKRKNVFSGSSESDDGGAEVKRERGEEQKNEPGGRGGTDWDEDMEDEPEEWKLSTVGNSDRGGPVTDAREDQ